MTATDKGIDQLRTRMLGAGRAFVGVQLVASRSRTMTLNARLAASKLGGSGAAFSVVVQALDEVVSELSELVASVEAARAHAIRSVASFTQSEHALRLSLHALAGADAKGRRRPTTVGVLQSGTGAGWSEAPESAEPGSLGAHLWEVLVALRDEMLLSLRALQDASRELARLVESVDVLAASHGFFIGINGVIEAAYIGQSDLAQLASDLQALTADIDAAVSVAREEAASLVSLAEASTGALRGEINDALLRREQLTKEVVA